MNHTFSSFILGQPSLDINTDFDGTTIRAVGGAVVYSGFAGAALGHKMAVLPKAAADVDVAAVFKEAPNVTVFPAYSETSTSISNVYHTADRERRTCRAISKIAPYRVDEIPDVDAAIYHVAGLMVGDLNEDIIAYASKKAMAAVDVQCLLRNEEDGAMVFRDWEKKLEILPLIHFLKTDAAEAEILTGLTDRAAAAKKLFDWGAKEIMITHNSEVLIYDGKTIYTQPLVPRNLSGRTGRGDTCFSGYITQRLQMGIPEALKMAAALVSLKMEIPGPFMGTREDVEAYKNTYYQ